jgi:hypothetical protein
MNDKEPINWGLLIAGFTSGVIMFFAVIGFYTVITWVFD